MEDPTLGPLPVLIIIVYSLYTCTQSEFTLTAMFAASLLGRFVCRRKDLRLNKSVSSKVLLLGQQQGPLTGQQQGPLMDNIMPDLDDSSDDTDDESL